LALTETWWVTWRDLEPVQSALVQANAAHCDAVLHQVLAENKRAGRTPATYRELADMLHRHSRNFGRWRTGRSKPSLLDMQSVAFLLRKEVTEILPDDRQRIAGATVILCGHRVSLEEARAYSAYRLAPRGSGGDSLEPMVLQSVVQALAPVFADIRALKQAIWKVAEHLEPVLDEVARSSI
jgi:hypothetical protein